MEWVNDENVNDVYCVLTLKKPANKISLYLNDSIYFERSDKNKFNCISCNFCLPLKKVDETFIFSVFSDESKLDKNEFEVTIYPRTLGGMI